jgi:hypothetical protein
LEWPEEERRRNRSGKAVVATPNSLLVTRPCESVHKLETFLVLAIVPKILEASEERGPVQYLIAEFLR